MAEVKVYGEVGPTRAGDGAVVPLRQLGNGALAVAAIQGKYTEPMLRGKMFYANSVARAMSLPATAEIGLIVWNPPDSGVVLALHKYSARVIVTSATLTGIDLAHGYQTTSPTSVTAADETGATVLGSSLVPGKAKAYAIATVLVAPTVAMGLLHNTAAIAVTGVDAVQGDFEGLFGVLPGGFVCFAAAGAAAAASGANASLTWEEIPLPVYAS
jgi:hypothetical protein